LEKDWGPSARSLAFCRCNTDTIVAVWVRNWADWMPGVGRLFVLLAYRALNRASGGGSVGTILAAGLTSTLVQALANLAVVNGDHYPTQAFPCPLYYGGSSMITSMACVGYCYPYHAGGCRRHLSVNGVPAPDESSAASAQAPVER